MSVETVLTFHVAAEAAEDGGDGLTFELSGRGALATPAPAVRVDGAPVSSGYVFDPGDDETRATITFESSMAGRVVTCDYSWSFECPAESDLSVYEFGRESNAKLVKDVNGRVMIVEPGARVTEWRGRLVWEYAGRALWDDLRRIAELPGSTFDVARASLGAPFDALTGLYALDYPEFGEIAGMPGRTRITMNVAKIN